jgi:hypothetical protein
MRVVASDPALDWINERGGRLYLWLKKERCCNAGLRLVSATDPPLGRDFERIPDCDRFDLYLPTHLGRQPDELHLELRRFPARLDAYWNGCAWIT